MLQVKDPQEVFDEIVRSAIQADLPEGEEIPEGVLNNTYSIFVLGEMYGTISTCLAQNIPIPKEMWDMPVVKSFVRGDVDDVVVVKPEDLIKLPKELYDSVVESAKAKGIIIP